MPILEKIMEMVPIMLMGYAWVRIFRLRRRIPGGVMKTACNILSELIGLFFAGYLAVPFYSMLPEYSREVLTGIMFLFAALFAVIVINLFQMILEEAGV